MLWSFDESDNDDDDDSDDIDDNGYGDHLNFHFDDKTASYDDADEDDDDDDKVKYGELGIDNNDEKHLMTIPMWGRNMAKRTQMTMVVALIPKMCHNPWI